MTFLSLLPAVGSALVWVPAAAYLILTGAAVEGHLLDPRGRAGDRADRQRAAPDPGRARHPAAGLRGAGLDARRHLDLRHQRLRDRPADRGAVHGRLDALPRRAGRAAGGWSGRPQVADRSADRPGLHRACSGRLRRAAGTGERGAGMAFFQKLKERLFKSSSKIEEGLDAIIDEAPAEPPRRAAGRAEPEEAARPGPRRPAPRAGQGARARRRHAREPRGAADPVRHGRRDLAQGRGRASPRAASAAGSGRARSARCWRARSPAILEPVARPMPIYPRRPQVVLVVGVNGSGKTTTIGKLASQFRAAGKKVVIAAGDTFRAAAVEQLQILGRARRRAGDDGAAGVGPGEPRLRRAGAGRGGGGGPAAHRHRRAAAEPRGPDGRARQDRAGASASATRRRRTTRCWCSTPRPARTPSARSRSSAGSPTSPAS